MFCRALTLTALWLSISLVLAEDVDTCDGDSTGAACQEDQLARVEEELTATMRQELLQVNILKGKALRQDPEGDADVNVSNANITVGKPIAAHPVNVAPDVALKSVQASALSQTNQTSSGSPVYDFYMYRAQDDKDYDLENVNMANLAGVMWYLHHEIVTACPRRFGVTRIRRFRIRTKATPELYATGRNFGWRYAFDAGRCSDYNGGCVKKEYSNLGYNVGCNKFTSEWAYPGNREDPQYEGGIWFSLPGECPSMKWDEATAQCKADEPGGKCEHPTGAHDCTWSIEDAGDISVDELVGNPLRYEGNEAFCARGCKEYSFNNPRDLGLCTNFWDGLYHEWKNYKRIERAQWMFETKYPDMPILEDPECDFEDPDGFWKEAR